MKIKIYGFFFYVIDPDKMGSSLFHYYTNGVSLNNESNHIWSEYKITNGPDPYYSWEAEWFTSIESQQSLQRTVKLKGYPQIPTGTYSCHFTYSSPTKIEQDKRILNNGRLWIGGISSEKIQIAVLK